MGNGLLFKKGKRGTDSCPKLPKQFLVNATKEGGNDKRNVFPIDVRHVRVRAGFWLVKRLNKVGWRVDTNHSKNETKCFSIIHIHQIRKNIAKSMIV